MLAGPAVHFDSTSIWKGTRSSRFARFIGQNNSVLDTRPVLFQVARTEKVVDEWIVATTWLHSQQPGLENTEPALP